MDWVGAPAGLSTWGWVSRQAHRTCAAMVDGALTVSRLTKIKCRRVRAHRSTHRHQAKSPTPKTIKQCALARWWKVKTGRLRLRGDDLQKKPDRAAGGRPASSSDWKCPGVALLCSPVWPRLWPSYRSSLA